MDEKYYTFQVKLHRKAEGTDEPETHEFRDCNDQRIQQLRNDVWTKGLRINHSPTMWEIVSPFSIKQVFIIQQDKKYNL